MRRAYIVADLPVSPVQSIIMSEARKILVTSALPYANGSIHLGHMLEYIQTDMWVRFQKLRGNQATYVCADDAHGSAIMLRAPPRPSSAGWKTKTAVPLKPRFSAR